MTDSTLLLGAVSAMAGVVAFLWKQISSYHTEVILGRKECEEDRERLHKEQQELWKAIYQMYPAAVTTYKRPQD